jgi:Mg-chelatase subunit ChlD
MTTKTHIYFLLDRTGSMEPMAADVIGGFNTFLKDQLADGDDARMTLVQFDSDEPFEVLANAKKLASIPKLTSATFQPRGMTPLLDATGDIIKFAEKRVQERQEAKKSAEQILVVTFTDGEENASHRFTRAHVLDLVAAKQAEGWTFAFLGAGLDAYGESGGIGYAAGSTQAWAPDGQGAVVAFDSLSKATVAMRGKARRGEHIDHHDFFEGDKAAEADRVARKGS